MAAVRTSPNIIRMRMLIQDQLLKLTTPLIRGIRIIEQYFNPEMLDK